MSKSPGPIALAAALLILALGAGFQAYQYPGAVDEAQSIVTTPPVGKPTVKQKAEELSARMAAWNSPVAWTEPANHHRLFNPEDYLFYPGLYPGQNYIQKDDGTARSNGGVLLSYYKKYGFDITDPNIDRADPDNDGFSNETEFKNEQIGQRLKAADCDGKNATNPMDPQSHPPYLARLRLKQYSKQSFHIRFNGYQQLNGQYLFQIFFTDLSSEKQPQLKKTGDALGEGYTVGKFNLSIVNKEDPNTHLVEPVDESTLEIIKPDIGLTITLPLRQTVDSPESTADFIMLMPTERDKVMKVPRGKILVVPFISDTKYLIIDIDDNGAKIRDMNTKKDYNILKLIDSEWDEVPLSPSTPANP